VQFRTSIQRLALRIDTQIRIADAIGKIVAQTTRKFPGVAALMPICPFAIRNKSAIGTMGH